MFDLQRISFLHQSITTGWLLFIATIKNCWILMGFIYVNITCWIVFFFSLLLAPETFKIFVKWFLYILPLIKIFFFFPRFILFLHLEIDFLPFYILCFQAEYKRFCTLSNWQANTHVKLSELVKFGRILKWLWKTNISFSILMRKK